MGGQDRQDYCQKTSAEMTAAVGGLARETSAMTILSAHGVMYAEQLVENLSCSI